MRYLLDTHYLLWAIFDMDKISKKTGDLIADPEQQIFVSTISFWEIALKSSLGKLKLIGCSPEYIPGICTKTGFEIIELSSRDSSSYHLLNASYHKDPFDRMLIWQAMRNNYTLITEDKQISKYRSEGLLVLTG